jgi:hypothetical protein
VCLCNEALNSEERLDFVRWQPNGKPDIEKRPKSRAFFGGGKETRTPDPYAASVMLYQLSYAPTSRTALFIMPRLPAFAVLLVGLSRRAKQRPRGGAVPCDLACAIIPAAGPVCYHLGGGSRYQSGVEG